MKRTNAFSLAEIVVVLMIIGVIAAMTLPTLMDTAEKKELATGLQKAHSTLTQAVSRMEIENGPVGKTRYWTKPAEFWSLFTAEMNTTKVCTGAQEGCFTSGTMKALNGNNWAEYEKRDYGVRTADGMSFSFSSTLCAADKGVSEADIKNGLGRFLVDVNGDKGPNKFGEDLYFFCLVKEKGIVPAGTDTSKSGDDCYRKGNGITCAAKVLKAGKIDYPYDKPTASSDKDKPKK